MPLERHSVSGNINELNLTGQIHSGVAEKVWTHLSGRVHQEKREDPDLLKKKFLVSLGLFFPRCCSPLPPRPSPVFSTIPWAQPIPSGPVTKVSHPPARTPTSPRKLLLHLSHTPSSSLLSCPPSRSRNRRPSPSSSPLLSLFPSPPFHSRSCPPSSSPSCPHSPSFSPPPSLFLSPHSLNPSSCG